MTPNHPPALDQEIGLLVARRNGADRWLRRHETVRQPGAAHDARHLYALSRVARTLPPILARRAAPGDAGEVDCFLAAVARTVRARAAQAGNAAAAAPPLALDP